MRRYIDRVVMITGAGQGLGRAIAERFALEGGTLALCDINGVALQEAAQACDPARTVASVLDVTRSEAVNRWVSDTLASFGRIDVLINNAGIFRDNPLESMSDEDWQAVLDVSLRGMFNCCRAVFGHMKSRRYGRILSISSIAWRGHFGSANYAAAKAGIVGVARTAALEGARHAVTSNVIAPGAISTPLLASLKPSARERLATRIPMGRVGDPVDVAEAAAYLCSEAAGYVTGVVLDVDGGISIGSALRWRPPIAGVARADEIQSPPGNELSIASPEFRMCLRMARSARAPSPSRIAAPMSSCSPADVLI
jgi:3-oxoacyl-[acyl-carrier protein] reductase